MKVLVGMSGGLDSSYTARMLKKAGHTVEGAFLKMFDSSSEDAALRAAEELDVPLHILDCREAFEEHVLCPFTNCYQRGLTPNPCVECNRYVKIRTLCDYAQKNGFDKVVTGHYGRVIRTESGRYCVARAKNEKKDQSYVLWGLSQSDLRMLYLPLSGEDKDEMRNIAEKEGLSSAKSKESMDICFLPDGGYDRFIESRIGKCPEGDFIDRDGKVIGRHKGIIRYTIGQRKHLGASFGQHMFVSKIDPENNTVTLVPQGEEFGNKAIAEDLVFQALPEQTEGKDDSLCVKLRYAQKPVPVSVTFNEKKAYMTFSSPVRAVTPGQSAVFYKGDLIAFGGYIAKE